MTDDPVTLDELRSIVEPLAAAIGALRRRVDDLERADRDRTIAPDQPPEEDLNDPTP